MSYMKVTDLPIDDNTNASENSYISGDVVDVGGVVKSYTEYTAHENIQKTFRS